MPASGRPVAIVLADLDEGLGDDVGLDALGRGIGMLVGDLAEIAEGLDRVLFDALAVLIHQPELPERHRLAGGCGILERRNQCRRWKCRRRRRRGRWPC